MVLKQLLGMVDVDRFARAMCETNRERIAGVMAEGSDEKSRLQYRHYIFEFEDRMLEKLDADLSDTGENLVRYQAQEILVDYIIDEYGSNGDGEGEQHNAD